MGPLWTILGLTTTTGSLLCSVIPAGRNTFAYRPAIHQFRPRVAISGLEMGVQSSDPFVFVANVSNTV